MANSKNVIIFLEKKKANHYQEIGFSILVAILCAMLEFTIEKISKFYIIYMNQTLIAIKINFTPKKTQIYMYVWTPPPTPNKVFLLWQSSWDHFIAPV